jgi:hypothetical protein
MNPPSPDALSAELSFFDPPAGGRAVYRPGTGLVPHPVRIVDGRRLAPAPDLDREGFQLADEPSQFQDFASRDAVIDCYCPAAERILERRTGASRAIAFDFTIRQNARERAARVQSPALRIHADFTDASGRDIAARLVAAAGLPASVLEQRFAIVNLWRPIGGPVREWPLAFCDARSLAEEDYILTDLVAQSGASESYSFRFNPAQRWYYFPAMSPSEIALIKVFDSACDGRARFVPHGSFADPATPKDAPPRHSIEVRILALFGG